MRYYSCKLELRRHTIDQTFDGGGWQLNCKLSSHCFEGSSTAGPHRVILQVSMWRKQISFGMPYAVLFADAGLTWLLVKHLFVQLRILHGLGQGFSITSLHWSLDGLPVYSSSSKQCPSWALRKATGQLVLLTGFYSTFKAALAHACFPLKISLPHVCLHWLRPLKVACMFQQAASSSSDLVWESSQVCTYYMQGSCHYVNTWCYSTRCTLFKWCADIPGLGNFAGLHVLHAGDVSLWQHVPI